MTTERRGLRARKAAPAVEAPPAAPPIPAAKTVTVATVTHEFGRRRSIVMLVWGDDPEKKVALPIPYGCPLEAVPAAAAGALQALAEELATITIAPV